MGTAQNVRHDRMSGNGSNPEYRGSDYETAADQTTSPPHASSDEIRRDIDRTRHEMDSTLDELGARLNPRSLADDLYGLARSFLPTGWSGSASHGVSESARSMGHSVGHSARHMGEKIPTDEIAHQAKRVGASALDAIRENPIPSLLGGAALAYLLLEDPAKREYRRRVYDRRFDEVNGLREHSGSYVDARTGEPYDDSYGHEYRAAPPTSSGSFSSSGSSGPGMMEQVKGTAAGVGRSASDQAGRMSDAAGHAASSAGCSASSAGHSIKEGAKSAAEWVSGAAQSLGEQVSHAGHAAGEYLHSGGEQLSSAGYRARSGSMAAGRRVSRGARSAGYSLSDNAQAGYAFSRDRYDRAMEETPLLVGLGCLALGLVAGFAIPRTRQEDELMGPQSDELKHQAREKAVEVQHQAEELMHEGQAKAEQMLHEGQAKAKDLLHQGQEKAAEAALKAMDKAEAKGITPASLVEKATSKAHEAVDKATATVKEKAGEAGDKARQKADEKGLGGSTGASDKSSESCSIEGSSLGTGFAESGSKSSGSSSPAITGTSSNTGEITMPADPTLTGYGQLAEENRNPTGSSSLTGSASSTGSSLPSGSATKPSTTAFQVSDGSKAGDTTLDRGDASESKSKQQDELMKNKGCSSDDSCCD